MQDLSDDEYTCLSNPLEWINVKICEQSILGLLVALADEDTADIYVGRNPQSGCRGTQIIILIGKGLNVNTEERFTSLLAELKIKNSLTKNMVSCHTGTQRVIY